MVRVGPEKKCGASLSKMSHKALSPTSLPFFPREEEGERKETNKQLEAGRPHFEFQTAG